MTFGIALVLAGSLAHASWNVLAKAGANEGRVFVLAYSLCALTLTALALLLQATVGGGAEVSWSVALWGLASAALHTAYALSLQRAYTRADLSLVYPVARGLGPLLAVLAGVLIFGETFGLLQAVGVALVIGGILACSKVGAVDRQAWSRAAAVGAPVGIAIAGYTIWDDYVVAQLDADPVAYYAFTVLFQALVLLVVCRRSVRSDLPRVMREHAARLWAVGALAGASYLAVLFAMQLIPLSLVAPLRASSVVFGTIAAAIWLKESGAAQRLAGSLTICVGLALIVANA